MNTAAETTMFAANPLEVVAEQLAALLRAGLDDEFARKFRSEASSMPFVDAEILVSLVNNQMNMGARRRNLRLVMSQRSECTKITVMDDSRLFGDGWPIARQTFAI